MKWLTLAVVLCLAFAGCSGNKDDAEPTSTETGTTTSATSTTGVPRGSIEVTLNRTTANGAAPLTVNFTLNATFTAPNGTVVPTPGLASWNVTYVLLANATGNGTGNATGNGTGNATGNGTGEGNMAQGPVGTTFPANVTLEINATGNYSVVVTVYAPGYEDGNASFLVGVLDGAGGGAVVFFEGGELDASQWTLQSRIYFNSNLGSQVPTQEIAQNHPDGGWRITDGDARDGTNSWTTPYPDNYRARMTSVAFTVPAGAVLSYWVKGGAEANNVDGLHVLVGAAPASVERVAYHTGTIADWTEFTVDLAAFAGQEIVLQFRFDSDVSCSSDTGLPAGCGAGYDGGGFFLDDITVA
jgi:hypothetical protein